MPFIPLDIPAGVYRTGTDLEASGRWRDANLVRWADGSMRPVGGWSEKWDASASVTASPRSMHCWINNNGDTSTAIGTCNELLYVNASGTAFDITPAGFNTGNNDAVINTSFGGTFYNSGLYGVKRPAIGEFQEADTWSIDNWGEYLVGCCTSDGKLYEWQGDSAVVAAQISGSPTSCAALVVTEERFIFALQSGGNPRKVAWCDREDNTTWTPAINNEAGDIELQTSGEIMCGVRMRGRTLILTNIDAHIATYQGAPYVYGFERVGSACGVASRKAAVGIDSGAFWMGKEAFYMFDGSIATQINCDVADYVFEQMNKNQITKVFALHNSEYGEIWWFYPSEDSLECNSYVAFDYRENHWEIGRIDRSCGFDQGVFDEPIWVDSSGVFYEHELHNVGHGNSTPYAETAPIALGAGDQVMKVISMIPDEKTQGDVQAYFKTRFHPNDTERAYGPYTMANPTSVRFTGRQIRMRIEATSNSDFRVGVMRIDVEAGGGR